METVHRISAKKIRAARTEMGLSQAAFARRVGVGWRAPIRWEKGTSQPSPHNLMRIAEVTGKDVAWFYEDTLAEEPEAARTRAVAQLGEGIATALIAAAPALMPALLAALSDSKPEGAKAS